MYVMLWNIFHFYLTFLSSTSAASEMKAYHYHSFTWLTTQSLHSNSSQASKQRSSSSLHKYQMIILQGLFLFHEKSWVILRLMWYNAVCTVMMMTVVSVVVVWTHLILYSRYMQKTHKASYNTTFSIFFIITTITIIITVVGSNNRTVSNGIRQVPYVLFWYKDDNEVTISFFSLLTISNFRAFL